MHRVDLGTDYELGKGLDHGLDPDPDSLQERHDLDPDPLQAVLDLDRDRVR